MTQEKSPPLPVLVATRAASMTNDPALKAAFSHDDEGGLPLTAEEIAAVNELAQKWAEANLARYQEYLFDHVRKLLLMGIPVSMALEQLTVDPRKILLNEEELDASSRGTRLPPNGRWLVITNNGEVQTLIDAKDSCLVNGKDPMNVYTFVREFVGRDALQPLIKVAIERLSTMAKHAPRTWPDD